MHRAILRLPSYKESLILVDHKNRNGLDNQKKNLRTCSKSQNNANAKPRLGNSAYKGVSKYSSKYRARIKYNKQTFCLGSYVSEIDAAKAYDLKAKELFGDFAHLNFHENNS